MTDRPPVPQFANSPLGNKCQGSPRGGKRKATDTPTPSSHQSLSQLPQTNETPISNKVAIPRMYSEEGGGLDSRSQDISKIDRTNHACEPCRTRKTKCSGERPICKHCRQFNITCIYADGKRDKVKRHQERMECKIALYEALLVEAGPNVGPNIWSRFQRARSLSGDIAVETGESVGEAHDFAGPVKGENARSASEGSMDAVDFVCEDVTRNKATQASGFIGKASEVDWQRNLNEKEDAMPWNTSRFQSPEGTHRSNISVSDMSYQTTRPTLAELSNPGLKPYEVPPLQVANALSGIFFQSVYPSFPMLPRYNFEAQLNRAYGGHFERDAKPNDRWRAIMNLVFAIGARYLQRTNDRFPFVQDSHEVFFARAARLGLAGKAFLELADLQQVQIYGLSSFYLTTVNHINRAWMLAGLALRGSVALGLQVEIRSDELSEYSKEARYRLWWAIYGLETMLQVMTGRPAAISLYGFSTPMPSPYGESHFNTSKSSQTDLSMSRLSQVSYREGNVAVEGKLHDPRTGSSASSQPSEPAKTQYLATEELSDSLYFVYRARLCLIVHEVLQTLYQPGSAHFVWSQVQSGIQRFNRSLDDWQSQLPEGFDFRKHQTNEWEHNRNHLAMLFYSVKMLTNRPCLCEMSAAEPAQTEASQEFNNTSAKICVQSAMEILNLLPFDQKSASWAMRGPWWSIIHYIFSSVTVVTIAIFYECRHVGADRQSSLFQLAKHGLKWLHLLAKEPNEGADRAWRIAATTLARISDRIGVDITDAPLPPEAFSAQEMQEQQQRMGADTSKFGLPLMDVAQSASMGGGGLEPVSYQGLGAMNAGIMGSNADMNSLYGYLFTSYEAPDGYPVESLPKQDGHMTSPTPQHHSSTSNPFLSQEMTDHGVDPYPNARGGMPAVVPMGYADTPIQMPAGQGVQSWSLRDQTPQQVSGFAPSAGEMNYEDSSRSTTRKK